MPPSRPALLLNDFPLTRARTVAEACERVGRSFSPHRLELRGPAEGLDVCHNQVRFRDLSLNTLSYGADVLIDPGQRGDFFMVQMPLSGSGMLLSGDTQVRMDERTLTVLKPRERCRMVWQGDCRMILLQIPHRVVQQRGAPAAAALRSAHPRDDPKVAAWWQSVLDIACNLDRFGAQWLQHPAAYAAMEEFLLSAFTALLVPPADEPAPAGAVEQRCVRRALEYIHAHLDQALRLQEIAAHACVSARTLEAAFRRHGHPPPLALARRERLNAVHEALRRAAVHGEQPTVTQVAMAHGFIHMGRFAAQYRRQFGCTPSDTLRLH